MSQLISEEELRAECEKRKKIFDRGVAFVQIQLCNGEWSNVGAYHDYETAEDRANQLQIEYTRRNHRMYHFRVN